MSQHDFIIDNQSGAAFRADVNGALGALATCSSGATEPATKYAFQWWADTASGILKQRNAANTAWLSVLTLATGNPLSLTTAQTSYKNKLINPNFSINQRAYQSGATVGAGLYGHDRWKMAAAGDTYTYTSSANVVPITIPAGKVFRQVIEGASLQSGTYVLSWTGTAQGKIGAGSYGASGITGAVVGGADLTIEFGAGTLSKVQFEEGSVPTLFETRPHGMEEALCHRYYERLVAIGTAKAFATGQCYSTTIVEAPVYFAPKRGVPTLTYSFADGVYCRNATGSEISTTAIASQGGCRNSLSVRFTVASGLIAGNASSISFYSNSHWLAFDAEI